MRLVRPITFADLQALEQLAVVAGGSMSTLPANRDHLSEMIARTQQSLRADVDQPGEQSYHFVLEETDTGEILGVSGIDAAVGLDTPFYSYRIEQLVHASSDLQIHNRIPALHLCQDYTGASRLCSLFLAPEHRNSDNLNLLSRARMLFMACHRQRFADKTLVELQGIVDDANKSPFWEAIGRHFFSMDFSRANYLTGIQSKSFIADLMPHYPVYIPLLPDEAQEVIAAPRPDIVPVVELLEAEGFRHRGYVDIFDAGPTLELATDQIKTLDQSRTQAFESLAASDADLPAALLCNQQLAGFRCVMTTAPVSRDELETRIAEPLQLSAGDELRLQPLAP
ncbi:arginine N-succinyltransferase [Motiliproteus coralliicola]|uniref:Arginine N-succinyltransferase n=1 Tax=Motiliproteus coralliicola TaxID=2283196 RepID=A0A369W9A5_9GAMM|nr:arginine N-succinyltransferase [Motiliproteus coralliicola]RDE18237.1 arginine N-succinyltransferase [Motiliproteus coralliicola]